MMSCECDNWCRDASDLLTSHHHRCKHYTDSLIDVWRVTCDGATYVTDEEEDTDDVQHGDIVTKERMHLEIYEQLPEFEGL